MSIDHNKLHFGWKHEWKYRWLYLHEKNKSEFSQIVRIYISIRHHAQTQCFSASHFLLFNENCTLGITYFILFRKSLLISKSMCITKWQLFLKGPCLIWKKVREKFKIVSLQWALALWKNLCRVSRAFSYSVTKRTKW